MTPQLVACYFAPTNNPHEAWERMARVLASTAAIHLPDWSRSIERVQPAPAKSAIFSAANEANTQKLEHWASVVSRSADGQAMLILDVDTFFVRGVDDVLYRSFDLAYTIRAGLPGSLPLNAGVVFLRSSDRVRHFMRLWAEENRRMLEDAEYHRPWYRRFGGINQASFGKLLEDGVAQELGLELLTLPCVEWNCEDTSWPSFDPAVTRIVHLKGALRRCVFALSPMRGDLRELVRMWRELERSGAQLAAGVLRGRHA